MEASRVDCNVINIRNPRKSAQVVSLLVDTGSDHTSLPAKVLEKIGVKREKDVTLTMANGQTITRSAGYAIIRYDEFQTIDEVVFAEHGDELLIGARTLSGFNARLDLLQGKIVDAGPIQAATSKSREVTNAGASPRPRVSIRILRERWRRAAARSRKKELEACEGLVGAARDARLQRPVSASRGELHLAARSAASPAVCGADR